MITISTAYFTDIEAWADYSPRVEERDYFHHAESKLTSAKSFQEGYIDDRIINYEYLQFIINQNLGEEKITISEDDTKKVYVNTHHRFEYEGDDGIAFIREGELSSIVLMRGDAIQQIPLAWICKELKDLIINEVRREYEKI